MKTSEQMKTNELKPNEMEQASGGEIFTDLKEAVHKIFRDGNPGILFALLLEEILQNRP